MIYLTQIIGILLVAGALISSTANKALAQDWQLVWSDEFESDELDPTKWSFQIGTGNYYGLVNWGNNEQQYYTDREENLYIQEGKLHIRAIEEPFANKNYTSARIRSIHKGDWTYGMFEIRAKLPKGQGIWPAIWMMPTDNHYGGWPKSGEIDIVEMLGHEPNKIYGSVHYGPNWPNNQSKTGSHTLSDGLFSDDFHVFRIVWVPGAIYFYVNETLYFLVTPNHLAPYNWPFHKDFHFIMNVAVGGYWPGYPNETTSFPQEMIVDYVRVYEDANLVSTESFRHLPKSLQLAQNYPNPFNPTTNITFGLPKSGNVRLEVYNVMGQRVATLMNDQKPAGYHTVSFDAANLASGVYVYRLSAGNFVETRKMLLVK